MFFVKGILTLSVSRLEQYQDNPIYWLTVGPRQHSIIAITGSGSCELADISFLVHVELLWLICIDRRDRSRTFHFCPNYDRMFSVTGEFLLNLLQCEVFHCPSFQLRSDEEKTEVWTVFSSWTFQISLKIFISSGIGHRTPAAVTSVVGLCLDQVTSVLLTVNDDSVHHVRVHNPSPSRWLGMNWWLLDSSMIPWTCSPEWSLSFIVSTTISGWQSSLLER
jgi:hypothetical protein